MAVPEVLVDGLAFPESPRWHGEQLWFSDISNKAVCRVGADGSREVVAQLPDTPSGIGFLPDGTAIVVAMGIRQLLRIAPGGLEVHADLAGFAGDFLNDMVVDADGNAYVGTRTSTMRASWSPLREGFEVDAVLFVRPDGHASVAADAMVSPNGTVIAADGSYLVVAETYAHRLTRFDRAADGTLSNRRTFADVPRMFPDGICLDDEGAVWFGSPYSHEFVRVLDGGEVTDRVPLTGAVACTLGGPGRRTLYLLGGDPKVLVPPDAPPRPATGPRPPGSLTGGHIWTLAVEHGGVGLP